MEMHFPSISADEQILPFFNYTFSEFDHMVGLLLSQNKHSKALSSSLVDILLNYKRLKAAPSSYTKHFFIKYISNFHRFFPQNAGFEWLLKSFSEELLQFHSIEVEVLVDKIHGSSYMWEFYSRLTLLSGINHLDRDDLLTEACTALYSGEDIKAVRIMHCILLNSSSILTPCNLCNRFIEQASTFLNQVNTVRPKVRLTWELILLNDILSQKSN